jgi:hypothetical protein
MEMKNFYERRSCLMALETDLQKSVTMMTDPHERQFIMRAIQQKLCVNNVWVEANETIMIIDSGFNNGVTDAGIHLLETPVLDQKVDIVGATDNVDLLGLNMGTYDDVCTVVMGIVC